MKLMHVYVQVRDKVLEETARLRVDSDPWSCTVAEGEVDSYGPEKKKKKYAPIPNLTRR